jgi:hypothetical protein
MVSISWGRTRAMLFDFYQRFECACYGADISSRVEKYRPTSLDEVVSHKDITTTSQSSSPRRDMFPP